MSHASGHVIINIVLPNDGHEEQENGHLRREPCVVVDLAEGCSEEDCVETVRLAYRKLTRRHA